MLPLQMLWHRTRPYLQSTKSIWRLVRKTALVHMYGTYLSPLSTFCHCTHDARPTVNCVNVIPKRGRILESPPYALIEIFILCSSSAFALSASAESLLTCWVHASYARLKQSLRLHCGVGRQLMALFDQREVCSPEFVQACISVPCQSFCLEPLAILENL